MSILVKTGTIGWAVEMMTRCKRVRRAGWNGENMYLSLEELEIIDNGGNTKEQKSWLPFIAICTAQGDYVPWECLQADLLADDWELVNN